MGREGSSPSGSTMGWKLKESVGIPAVDERQGIQVVDPRATMKAGGSIPSHPTISTCAKSEALVHVTYVALSDELFQEDPTHERSHDNVCSTRHIYVAPWVVWSLGKLRAPPALGAIQSSHPLEARVVRALGCSPSC